jgi:hypothetical protein
MMCLFDGWLVCLYGCIWWVGCTHNSYTISVAVICIGSFQLLAFLLVLFLLIQLRKLRALQVCYGGGGGGGGFGFFLLLSFSFNLQFDDHMSMELALDKKFVHVWFLFFKICIAFFPFLCVRLPLSPTTG